MMIATICILLIGAGIANANVFSKVWSHAIRQSLYEQEVEDVNAIHKIDNHLARRLIVMPLTDAFKTNQVDAMFGKIQYGDKCSLPSSIGKLIYEKRYDVPWLFEIKPVPASSSSYAPTRPAPTPASNGDHEVTEEYYRRGKITKAYISPLDFRSPENFIFLPRWLMNDLDLMPQDLVDISFVRIKLAELVVFQPLSLAWDALLEQHPDPKSLLEHEINKYSSLTTGSTIFIEIQGKEYPLYVKETWAEGGVRVKAVRVQDSDVRTDIDRSLLDAIIEENDKDKRRAK